MHWSLGRAIFFSSSALHFSTSFEGIAFAEESLSTSSTSTTCPIITRDEGCKVSSDVETGVAVVRSVHPLRRRKTRLSDAQAIVVAYARGRAVSSNTRKGAMIAVGAGPDTIAPQLDDLSSLTIACYNSPESLTISGEPDDIRTLKERLDAESIFARILHTDGNAYHSPHMKALGEYYETELNDMLAELSSSDRTPQISQIDFMSTVYADHLGKKFPDARYWRQNLESQIGRAHV